MAFINIKDVTSNTKIKILPKIKPKEKNKNIFAETHLFLTLVFPSVSG